MKKIFILPLLMISYGLFAQETLNKFYNEYVSAKNTGTYFSDNTRGTPYDNPEFLEALVFLKGESEPLTGMMRYNSYEDEMEFIRNTDDQILVLTKRSSIDSIRLDNKTYQFLIVRMDDTEDLGYFIKLSGGKISLYRKSKKRFQEEKPPKSGYDTYEPPSFVQEKDEFYVSFDGDPLIMIPSGRKKIKEFFLEHGYENKEMSKVKYEEEELVEFFRGLVMGSE